VRAAIAALVLVTASGCIGYASYPVTRTVGGQARRGVFVAPPQYEHFVRGELAASSGDWRGAADAYQLARGSGDDDVLLCARLADALDHLGDRAHADEALARGEALDAHAEVIWRARGAIAERHGETDAAITAYGRAHDAEPASEEPVLALARLLDAERAATLLMDFVAHASPSLGATRAALALALARGDVVGLADAASELAHTAPAHTGEIELAIRALLARGDVIVAEHLLARLPDEVVDRELAIEVATRAGDRSGAERWLAVPTDERPAALVRDARHWLVLGDAARAEELAQVALTDDTSSSEATLVLAHARLIGGDAAGAAALFASIPIGSTAHDEAMRGLAEALAAAGLPALGAELAR
jgi:tetratricopeptide (TPR) repeat protein